MFLGTRDIVVLPRRGGGESGKRAVAREWGYSFVACVSDLTIDHAFLFRDGGSTVRTCSSKHV